jgi:hypothetical protein
MIRVLARLLVGMTRAFRFGIALDDLGFGLLLNEDSKKRRYLFFLLPLFFFVLDVVVEKEEIDFLHRLQRLGLVSLGFEQEC